MSTMGDQSDARNKARIPFEAVVEVADSGDSDPYEAQAVDVSGCGMHLRTAYLPDIGQDIACRFDAGAEPVTVTGSVVWRHAESRGGEFGIRFNDMSPEVSKALEAIVGTSGPEGLRQVMPAGRVHLHIAGLGRPMRARVRGTTNGEFTVASEFPFFQVGKSLGLEDAELGGNRAAVIDRVHVETDPDSHIPRLVIALRYESDAVAEVAQPGDATDEVPQPTVRARASVPPPKKAESVGSTQSVVDEAEAMKSPFARGAAKVTPAVLGMLKRVRDKAVDLSRKSTANADAPARRTTSPAPDGGLKTSGRAVVRDTFAAERPAGAAGFVQTHKRKLALGASAALAALLVFAAVHKSPAPVVQAAAPIDSAALASLSGLTLAPVAPAGATAPVTGTLPDAGALAALDPMLVNTAPAAVVAPMPAPPVAETHPTPSAKRTVPVHATPFTNGVVSHGNVLRLKMDGPIARINGAAQPSGFTVSIPDHKSLEPAGPLAARDSRIGSIRVTNDHGGAELDVTFKDGVPNYVVRAKGEYLEIVLAPIATASHAPTNAAKHPDAKPSKKTAHAHR